MARIKLRSDAHYETLIEGKLRYCFGGDPPDPDPRLGQASLEMAGAARDQLNFNRQVYEEGRPRQARMDSLAEQLVTQQMAMADEGRERSHELWRRWQNEFAPMESAFAREAGQAGGTADQEAFASRAAADFETAQAVQRGALERNMASMGVNPNSPRFMAAQRANELMAAATRAGMMNAGRQRAVDRGLALKGQAINVGRGLPALGMNNDQLALSAGQGTAASSMLGNNLLMQRVAGMNSGMNSSLNNMGDALSAGMAQHQSAVNATAAKNNMYGQLGGSALMAGAMFAASDARVKDLHRRVGTLDNGVPVYEFSYRDEFKAKHGEGVFIGVVAQDLLKVAPDAVLLGGDGYYMVDYSKLAGLGWNHFGRKE